MDILIGILIAILFLVGNVSKKKQEQAQREAKARTQTPPAADPRFPSEPSMQEKRIPPVWGEASPGSEGEPVQELPVRPARVLQRVQTYENNTQTEGGPAAARSVLMPTATVAAHMEATQGRHATLSHSLNVHSHTEGMESSFPAARKAVTAYELREPEGRGIALDVIKRLGHDPGAVAEGVILSEILGKPKALRRV